MGKVVHIKEVMNTTYPDGIKDRGAEGGSFPTYI